MRYIVTAILAIGATVCQARTIYVDANGTGNYPTIQAAVDDSTTGDVITLLPGTYTGIGNRDVNCDGKTITIQSIDPCDPAIVAATVIDCQQMGRGFKFVSGGYPLLAGLTIINGRALPMPPSSQQFGNAIYSRDSNSTILNCVIKKCGSYFGNITETIVCEYGNLMLIGCDINENSVAIDCTDSNTEITGCNIRNNYTGTSFRSHGDPWTPGINNTAKITDSIIANNIRAISCGRTNLTIEQSTISDNNMLASSHGIASIYAADSNVIINDSIISRNKSLYAPSSFEVIPDAGGVASVSGTLEMHNCVVSDNRSVYGGGISNYGGSATIKNCRITNNTAGGISANSQYYDGKGGGIYNYSPTQLIIEGCTIKNNKTEGKTINSNLTRGGGICSEGGNLSPKISIKRSSIIGNSAYQGGGVYTLKTADMNNCFLANNEAQTGGGAYCAPGSICINCTFVGNRAISAAGLAGGGGAVSNCIFWDDFFSGGQISSVFTVSYSNIRWDLYKNNSGNISIDPMFAFENDGHLLPGSPCIDAGTNILPTVYPPIELPTTDIDGNPRMIDGDLDGKSMVDMGAFEFDSTKSRLAISDSDFNFSCAQNGPNPEPQILQIRNCSGGNIDWEIVENCPWLNVSAKSGTSSGKPSSVIISLDANQLDIGTYQADMLVTSPGAAGSPQAVHITVQVGRLLSVPQNFNTIQKAIDEANNGDWVIVADGVYTGAGNREIDFMGKAITVSSQNGPENCIIDCNGSSTDGPYHFGFIFQTGETNRSILDGFTIMNGYRDFGGAIWISSYCAPTIKNCIFRKNVTTVQGGALWASPPNSNLVTAIDPIVIKHCNFIKNDTKDGGGAIFSGRSLKVTDCNFTGNATTGFSSRAAGGTIGLYASSTSCSALIEGCNFTENFASLGGAINAQPGTVGGNISIINSNFIGNTARDRAGALNIYPTFNTFMLNSIIAGNRANNNGGFILAGPAQMSNCTIAGNASFSSSPSSVILGNDAKVRNCIFSDYGPRVQTSSPDIKYNNVRGGLPLEGNIDLDSRFVRDGYWADANDANVILEPNDINAVWINGDYHLRIDSPCIDAGDPNFTALPEAIDFDGNPRVVDCSGYGKAIVDMGAYEYQNTPPVADAGPNQIAYAWIDEIAEVMLDASNSYDADGDSLTYIWKWSIDGNDYETNGITPTIELPVGEYTFELVVNDGKEDSEPNYVEITVVEAIKSTLWVTPRIVDYKCFGQKHFMAIMQLPAGISKTQIDANEKLTCYPGEIKASRQFIMSHYDCKHIEKVVILAHFDSNSLTDTVRKTGLVDVDVVGQLKTGQYFYGSDKVWVIKPPRKRVWCWPGYGWGWGVGNYDGKNID